MNRKSLNNGMFLKLLAVFLVLAMVIGTVPVSAKSRKTEEIPAVVVSSKKQLVNRLKTDGEAKIIFTTDKAVSITIPSEPYSSQKHLVIRAANASITNKAKFASVSIEAVKYYTEKTSGNEINVTADGAWINVYNKKKVAKLTIDADNVEISVKKKAEIKDLTIKHKAGSNIRLEATNDSKVNANLTKKTNLTVTGVKSADVNIVSSYKNNTVKAYIPVDITASKKMKLETNAGSEGTTVDKTKSSVKVSITDKSKKAPTVTVAGKAQTTPTPKPTSTATPKPTVTAVPTATAAPTSGGEIYGYGGGSSSGGSSSGGYSGGGSSSGGYSGGSSSGGYSGGSSSDGSSSGGGYTPAPTADSVTPAPVTPTAEPVDPVTPTEVVTPTEIAIPTEMVTPTEEVTPETDISKQEEIELIYLSETEVYNKIISLEKNYPEGTIWTNENKYTWKGQVTEKLGLSEMNGYGCVAFAMMASDEVFGDKPVYKYTDSSIIQPGDILRVDDDTHTVIVLSILGDYITVAEGNYSSMVHWGRILSLSESGFVYGYTRYGDPDEIKKASLNKPDDTIISYADGTVRTISCLNEDCEVYVEKTEKSGITTICNFDFGTNGGRRVLSEMSYDNGKVLYTKEYYYSEKGKLTEVRCHYTELYYYNLKPEKDEIITYGEYGEVLTEKVIIDSNQTNILEYTYLYQGGKTIKDSLLYTMPSGEKITYNYEYDDQGRKIRYPYICFDNGFGWDIELAYSEDGSYIETSISTDGRKMIVKYDERGNAISYELYKNDVFSEGRLWEYDDDGNCITVESYDKNRECQLKIELEYEDSVEISRLYYYAVDHTSFQIIHNTSGILEKCIYTGPDGNVTEYMVNSSNDPLGLSYAGFDEEVNEYNIHQYDETELICKNIYVKHGIITVENLNQEVLESSSSDKLLVAIFSREDVRELQYIDINGESKTAKTGEWYDDLSGYHVLRIETSKFDKPWPFSIIEETVSDDIIKSYIVSRSYSENGWSGRWTFTDKEERFSTEGELYIEYRNTISSSFDENGDSCGSEEIEERYDGRDYLVSKKITRRNSLGNVTTVFDDYYLKNFNLPTGVTYLKRIGEEYSYNKDGSIHLSNKYVNEYNPDDNNMIVKGETIYYNDNGEVKNSWEYKRVNEHYSIEAQGGFVSGFNCTNEIETYKDAEGKIMYVCENQYEVYVGDDGIVYRNKTGTMTYPSGVKYSYNPYTNQYDILIK